MNAFERNNKRPIEMHCPLLEKVIPDDVYYDVIMSVDDFFKMSAVFDLSGVTRENARKVWLPLPNADAGGEDNDMDEKSGS